MGDTEPSIILAPPPEIGVSVLAPVYNERESLPQLHTELVQALAALPEPAEVVYVDDGSTDGSAEELDALPRGAAAGGVRVVVVKLRRNYGQTAAVAAAIDHAAGRVLVPIDADLQNDPADIPRLLAKLGEGWDVVSGWRQRRQDAALTRRLPSYWANRLISWVTGVRLRDYGCSLKAYRREVLSEVRLYGEMHRFIPVYASLQGARVTELPVNHRPRRFGRSKYGLGRIGKVLLDLLTVSFLARYATKPIYFFGGIGLASLAFSLVPMGLAVFFRLMPKEPGQATAGTDSWHKDFVETPLPVIAAVFLLFGLTSVMLGLQAEILMRTYYESQGKRTYLTRPDRLGRPPTG